MELQYAKLLIFYRIENQHVQFRVEPNPQNIDAEKVADILGKFLIFCMYLMQEES